ncbi:MAG: peptide deformylase [Chlamydiia bacterium]|nr:peptide deformylase [Chlamydiia bacterium]
MRRELCYYGNPILRTRCKEITDFESDEVRQLFEDLIDTVNSKPSLGLAAPQIGYAHRAFAITYTELDDEGYPIVTEHPKIYANPKITILDDTLWTHNEGCLSLPHLLVDVDRPWKIRIEAQDIHGQVFTEEHQGWMARPLLHENDHLNGVLTIDRIPKKERREVEPELKRIKKKYSS